MLQEASSVLEVVKPASNQVVLVTSGDLRLSANQECWAAQAELERQVKEAFAAEGIEVIRAFPFNEAEQHGFISSQRMGMDVFETIHPEAKLIFVTAAWQYTHHVLPGMRSHRGPILTIANWSGQWPGLVGLLNLNGSLTKAGVKFSSVWSTDFKDEFSRKGIREWLKTGAIKHDLSHVAALDRAKLPAAANETGKALAQHLRRHKAIMGIFDEGCMGMFNAIFEDDLLNAAGVFKERLSQSALVARMKEIPDAEAAAIYQWMKGRGITFVTGKDPKTALTDEQIQAQCKMYISAMRMASEFGCDLIGIQYQQGLKDSVPASDLVEALLNNPDRPAVYTADGKTELYAGAALPHFNEVDEGAGLDALVTNRCWSALGLDPSTTLHDVRWGEHFKGADIDAFVWVLQISGAVPASHLEGGYKGATSERQPAMYFPLGGGTLKGIGKPGEIVWSRIFVEGNALHADLGRGTVVSLPQAEVAHRWKNTTSQWPLVNAVLHGVSRDQFMARHRANHVNVVYAPDAATADNALAVKAAMLAEMGVTVHLCGDVCWK
jgi:hypothetical protein